MKYLFGLRKWGYPGILLLILVLSLLLSTPIKTHSSFEDSLPSDLVFTGSFEQRGSLTLALLDATSFEVTPLYTDETARELRVMDWSPQGDLMAVLSIDAKVNKNGGFSTHLCAVTVAGTLQTCFAGRFPDYYEEAPSMIDYNYLVSWSLDGQKIYYVTEDENRTVRRLVEADVVTGEIFRTVYEVARANDEHIPTLLTWDSDLKYVAAGVGLTERSGTLVNLETGEQLDLSKVVAAWPYSAGPSRPEGSGYICNSFSPQNNYLTAINEYDNRLIIFDKELNILYTVQDFGIGGRVKIYCPTWSVDENTVYFFVLNLDQEPNYIFTYSLQDNRLINRVVDAVYPPLVFSPERTHIAFEIPSPSTSKIHVLYPDGTIRLFGDPFQYAQYPIWRPAFDQ